MLRRLKAAFLRVAILRQYEKGDHSAAKKLFDRYWRVRHRDPVFRAIEATIDILDGDSPSARAKLVDLVNDLNEPRSDNGRYVRSYCEYYLCLMDRRTDCDELRLQALATGASRTLKGWLGLPGEPVPMDVE